MKRAAPRPAISVVVNNYNYGRFVLRAVASSLEQAGVDAEVIVVDDGSSDNSRAVLEECSGRVTVVFQENQGQAAAINAGVKISRGDILCFLDADDWCAPGKLAEIAKAFRADPKLALVYHRLQPVLADGTPTLRPIPRTLCAGDISPRLIRSAGWWPFPMTSAIAVRRAAWDAVGDIPEQFRISADAWLAGIYPFMGRVSALPDALGYYRIHNNNWYRPVDDEAMLRRRRAHWQATVEATNRFLAGRAMPGRVLLADHLPFHIAAARLDGADMRMRLGLVLKTALFAGEPDRLRRLRDALRLLRDLPSVERRVGLTEAAK